MADRALIHKSTNQNRECGIVIKQTAEEPALPAATAPKTNPPAGMNQRADRETSRCLMAAARRPFVRGATAPGPVHCSACFPAFPVILQSWFSASGCKARVQRCHTKPKVLWPSP